MEICFEPRLSRMVVFVCLTLIYFALVLMFLVWIAAEKFPFYEAPYFQWPVHIMRCSPGPPPPLWALAVGISPAMVGTVIGFRIGHPIRATVLAIAAAPFGLYLGDFIGHHYPEPLWLRQLHFSFLHG